MLKLELFEEFLLVFCLTFEAAIEYNRLMTFMTLQSYFTFFYHKINCLNFIYLSYYAFHFVLLLCFHVGNYVGIHVD